MLLLSYPAIETFIISNFENKMSEFDKRFDFETNTLKEYINDKHYDNHKMSIKTLSNAFIELVNSLLTSGHFFKKEFLDILLV